MDKPLKAEAKASAITTLRPTELKYLACHIVDFIVIFLSWDAWGDCLIQA
jgi:hypothetical protein